MMKPALRCSLTCLQSLGVAVEEVEEHEPTEVHWVPQKTSHKPPDLVCGCVSE